MTTAPSSLVTWRSIAAALLIIGISACSRPPAATRAYAHVRHLAGDIGSRPAGTEANRRAREYVVNELRAAGFEVRVQEVDAERPGLGVTARVANVIAVRPGARRDAVALVAHYDCVPDGPGAADDGLGVAVCLEAGRRLAARPSPVYTTAVILTDGEEFGLMGAAGVLKDPIRQRIRAALNFEAIGSGMPVLLFETGPESGALVRAWAGHAPWPAGASFMPAIYKAISAAGDRTDLGLFRRAGIAGLDFAAVGDGYTYHTRLDTWRRLDPRTLDQAVANAVATVESFERTAPSAPVEVGATYFDVLQARAVVYGHTGELVVFGLAFFVGSVAWFHVVGLARRSVRTSNLLLTVPWLLGGVAAVAVVMFAVAWLLRAARPVLHPWYAHPDRFFAALVLAALAAAWLLVRAGRALPASARGSLHPAAVWAMALPVWIVLAVLAGWAAPGAAFLVTWPLLAAAVALLAFATGRAAGMRAASAVTALVVAVVWLPDVVLFLHFAVSELGRDPLVTPLALYPALLLAAAVFIAPPGVALVVRSGEAPRALTGWLPGIVLAGAALAALAAAWAAPAYTADRPLHHAIRYVADIATGQAVWECGANEPAPPAANWREGSAVPPRAAALGAIPAPFVYHAPAPAPDSIPFVVSASLVRGAEAALEIRAVPRAPGWTVAFALPPGIVPLETNIAISMRKDRQVAVFHAVPAEGVTFRGRFEETDAEKLAETVVLAMGNGIPGASSPALPAWLPQQADVWQARSYYLLPVNWSSKP